MRTKKIQRPLQLMANQAAAPCQWYNTLPFKKRYFSHTCYGSIHVSTHRAIIFCNDLPIYKCNQALIHSRLIEVRGHDHLYDCMPSIEMKEREWPQIAE